MPAHLSHGRGEGARHQERQVADRRHQLVVTRRLDHSGARAHSLRQFRRQLQRLRVRARQRREHPRRIAIEAAFRRLKACRLLAAHGMAAHRLHARRQQVHRRADVALGAAHVHHQRARPESRPDLLQRGDNRAHRRRQDHDVGPQDARLQVIGRQIDGAGKEGVEHRLRAPRHAAHLAAEMPVLEVHAETGPHQAKPHHRH